MDAQIISDIAKELMRIKVTNSTTTILFAIFVLIAGALASIYLRKLTENFLKKMKVEKDVAVASGYVVYVLNSLISVSIALSTLKVSTTSIITILGIISISLLLAFKSSLENLGGSYILFFFKSFDVGDYIETNEIEGEVIDKQMFSTTIKTFDGSIVIVPNTNLTSQTVINHSRQGIRRVDVKFKVPYKVDVSIVKKMLTKMISTQDYIVKDRDFIVSVDELQDDGIKIIVIVWVKTEDYWDVYYTLTDKVEEVLRDNNIDMHIYTKFERK
ncbi:MAG: mechanosensitive ion channel family protein [Clostridium sp.]|nr:mechanosensitive ion channel family protein [Clostridium sp.]MBQ9000130.1 mechanosensitive ion channel family protein [Clostridium sp.]